MELITGMLLGGGIAYVTLLVKEQVDARQMARWQTWYASQDQTQGTQQSSNIPVKADLNQDTAVKPKTQPKPQPKPQPSQSPQMDESDEELDRLMSMVDDEE